MSADAQTLSVYDNKVAQYVKLTTDADANTHLTTFIEALPKGGRVLDLGCGPGHDAATMALAGLVVHATDASGEMVSLARQHKDVNVSQCGFDALDAQGVYHGIWASFSLLHVPKSALPGHLVAIHRALLPQGILALSMKLGDGESRDSLGRFYAYYTSAELDELLCTAGFTVTGFRGGLGKGLAGDTAPYIVITAHA